MTTVDELKLAGSVDLRLSKSFQSTVPHKPTQSGETTKTKQKNREGDFSSWWIITYFILVNHLIAAYALLFYRNVTWTMLGLSVLFSWLCLLGITGGFHRLWSHRAYSARLPLRVFMAVIGTMAFQGSIKWWVARHRVHHRFCDTEYDPYNAKRGFWFAHIGWLMEKSNYYDKMNLIDLSDLYADPVVYWQLRLIGYGYVILGLIVPAAIGYALGDTIGGIIWLGVMARVASWNGIWATNSLAHWYGDQPYSSACTARGSFISAFICNGEGNHNYHHEFPQDYRHGVKWYEWDPTKWVIWVSHKLGLAYDLHTTEDKVVKNAELSMKEERAKALVAQLQQTKSALRDRDITKLPIMSEDELQRQVREQGKLLIKISGYVHDVTAFQHKHPGGAKLFKAYQGRDASSAFDGGLNVHTQSARFLSDFFKVARVPANANAGKND